MCVFFHFFSTKLSQDFWWFMMNSEFLSCYQNSYKYVNVESVNTLRETRFLVWVELTLKQSMGGREMCWIEMILMRRRLLLILILKDISFRQDVTSNIKNRTSAISFCFFSDFQRFYKKIYVYTFMCRQCDIHLFSSNCVYLLFCMRF